MDLQVYPLTPDRWDDLEALFGSRGAVGGCWCMWWRIKRSEYDQQKGEGNRLAFRAIVEDGQRPGLLAYQASQPVGWVSAGPRSNYPVLARSRILKPVDDQPVWSIVCLFIDKSYRGQRLTVALLQATVNYAKTKGAKIVEGYPIEPKKAMMPTVFASTGFASAFRQAGFQEIARRSETRPIMRYIINDCLVM